MITDWAACHNRPFHVAICPDIAVVTKASETLYPALYASYEEALEVAHIALLSTRVRSGAGGGARRQTQ